MKKLNYADYMEGNIEIKEEDVKIILDHFNDEVQLSYDDQGRIYNEAGIYIADIKL